MATTIHEIFGYRSTDHSQASLNHASNMQCPFLEDQCTKTLNNGTIAGVCTLKPVTTGPVICCPVRLYANDYRILHDVSDMAFESSLSLRPGTSARDTAIRSGRDTVAVFGKRWGGELRLPQRKGSGSYFVDWILARLNQNGDLVEFVAVEVQSIDTTGNYQQARLNLLNHARRITAATAGFNWENVSKRILPQVIYKGNVLQRESMCLKGLFFVTPTPVHDRVMQRLGGQSTLLTYPLQSSSITFLSYDLNEASPLAPGHPVPLVLQRSFTTNIGQVAQAFAGPGVMPPQDCYQAAIRKALEP